MNPYTLRQHCTRGAPHHTTAQRNHIFRTTVWNEIFRFALFLPARTGCFFSGTDLHLNRPWWVRHADFACDLQR
jgi:hypothetical protein